MLHVLLLTIAVATLAWILPWRDLKLWRAAIILVVCTAIPFIVYEKRGFSDGLAAKQALHDFDYNTDELHLVRAQEHLDKHIGKHPDDALAYVILGRLHFSAHDYADSADAFAVAYETYEHDQDLWVEYAAALYLAQSEDEVLGDLLKKIAKAQGAKNKHE